MAVTDDELGPDEVRAMSLEVRLMRFREAKGLREALKRQDPGGRLAAIHAAEAFLELKSVQVPDPWEPPVVEPEPEPASDEDVEFEEKAATTFTAEERQKLADKGWAMPDGSFPIRNCQDLNDAARSVGRTPAAKRDAVRAHIRKMAKVHNCPLPDSYTSGK